MGPYHQDSDASCDKPWYKKNQAGNDRFRFANFPLRTAKDQTHQPPKYSEQTENDHWNRQRPFDTSHHLIPRIPRFFSQVWRVHTQ